MTIATMGFLLIGGMPVFDTICMSLGAQEPAVLPAVKTAARQIIPCISRPF